ncbi:MULTISPECIES: succinate dehydrogenase assembly factor 2 [Ectothiorhodospira]|uniref:FAD assembly factor SdhE n=1 Tax=Ectothiorhodospira TaxID=1051 RepID=UPI001EE99261|nr:MULTISPECIES: succinate dehydrogenase assembly factor 2 [Ectothiorhodospira]MCG5493001.1 succinate dehydrogenase assembly factor 2 [Ectothiorhodospira variabilis]MCG5497278.1 succinate dehydrogenase assembly factor 2 [Ectothiorhodospira variabilis]MCG5502330.1 succinate dehydrogenase assembly factor 2 [Ectothiorhodospira variabilis]MCG5505904.1 succinate dehydrogenase assembly factor 2 [Ectothiorhodospira variabilis]MCG5524551.1 succinate dehydrogenase assembly factor 2 [Ectothiorhodospira 
MSELSRLRWRCRRGTKELDLMLEGFVLSQGKSLPSEELALFEQVLDQQDDDLQRWLLYGEPVEVEAIRGMIQRVREHFLNR